jgi:hypothetical protein
MSDLPKRLQNSLNRIKGCGGVVLIHHTSAGSTDYQLQKERSDLEDKLRRVSA